MKPKPRALAGYVAEYDSPFPPAEMSDGVVGGAWADLARVTSGARAWKAASRLSRMSVQRVAVTHGVLKSEMKALKRVGTLGQLPLGGDFLELAELGGELVGELLKFSDALTMVASRVPVLGAYAQLIVTFVTFVARAFRQGEAEEITTGRKALGYNRDIDEEVTNDAVNVLGSRDWTELFTPAWRPGDSFKLVPTSFVGDGVADGQTLLPQAGALRSEGVGFVPGVGGRLVQWQWPLKVFGSNRPSSPWESIVSIADLEPSVSQLTVLAWQMVLRNSANMFRVDHRRLTSRWVDYFGQMLDFAKDLRKKGDKHGAEMVDGVATWIAREPVSSAPNKFRVRSPWRKYKPSNVPGSVTHSAGSLIRHILRRQLEDSQRPALGTVTCAYVGPGFAAIKADDALRQYWQEMRALLLTHDARFSVDLEMVPDREYRQALWQRTKTAEPRFTTVPPKKGFGKAPDVDPDPPKPPKPKDVEPTLPGGGKKDGGAGLLVAGVAAAVLYGLLG